MNDEPYAISIADFKRQTGLSHTTTYKLIKQKKIEIAKVGERTLVIYGSVKNLLKPGSVKTLVINTRKPKAALDGEAAQ